MLVITNLPMLNYTYFILNYDSKTLKDKNNFGTGPPNIKINVK